MDDVDKRETYAHASRFFFLLFLADIDAAESLLGVVGRDKEAYGQ